MARKRLIAEGDCVPQFRLTRLEGGEVSLAGVTAKGPALLAFFKISCPVCQLTFPFLERIHAGGSLPIFGVSQNDAGETSEFSRQYGITFPMLLDLEDDGFPASDDFGISSVPTLVMVEPGGTVSWTLEGFARKEMASLGAKAGVNPFQPGDYVPEWKAG